MGSTHSLIISVNTPEFGKVIIETSDGFRYFSDLMPISKVYCFPKNKTEWDQVSPESYGLALVWSSRFEVHLDQVIGLAYKTKKIQQSA